MIVFQIITVSLSILIQISCQQQISCTNDQINCCDSNCSSCSSEKISQCTGCQSQYYQFSEQYQCLKECPQGTYSLNEPKQCKPCLSQYCEQCSENSCIKCKAGFIPNPNDSNYCISSCDAQNNVLDEQGQCNLSCSDDIKYDIDSKSKSCVLKQSCPSLKKIPEVQNKDNIISTLIDKNKFFIF